MKVLKVFTLFLALMGTCSISAQTKLIVGDMNEDGRLSIEDVTRLTGTILGVTHSRIHSCNNGVRTYAGHDYVDLALPSGTLWAACNIGASVPEEYGDYFAWGETKGYKNGKTEFSQSSYSMYSTVYTNYTFEGKTELMLEDDAAYVNWGEGWRMPSQEQITELLDERFTIHEWTEQNGVIGSRIISRENGNSIFLPAAGYFNQDAHRYVGIFNYFWTRDLSPNTNSGAKADIYVMSMDGPRAEAQFRFYGLNVRPVLTKKSVLEVRLSTNSLSIDEGETALLAAQLYPSGISDVDVEWVSSNPEIASVAENGMVTANHYGVTSITARAMADNEIVATCIVNVSPYHECVDLQLPSGTLWATCNVGASVPEEFGYYYSWANNGLQKNYTWESYKWCNGTATSMTTYCTNPVYGEVDNRGTMRISDDAASVLWGVHWGIPTFAQLEELLDNKYTMLKEETLNGIKGMRIISRSNGKSVFFPYAGVKVGTSDVSVGDWGHYWSCELYPENDHAYVVNISSVIQKGKGLRYRGRTIRAVRK